MVYSIMPTYCFQCYEEDGGCGETFELQALMCDAPGLHPSCPSCNKIQPVRRDFPGESHTVFDASPQTLGALADRNTDKKSSDEIEHIRRKNTAYLNQPFTGKLPKGAVPLQKDNQGRRIVSKQHRRVDPRKSKEN